MKDFDFIDQLVSSSGIKFRLKYYIVALSLLFSVGIYRYYIEYFHKEKDFVSILAELLPYNYTTYKFFSHSNQDDVSIYRLFAEGVDEMSHDRMSISIKGKKGNAIENAYGVFTNPKSFGIIQSDTYLSVDFLEDKKKVKIITPLYMERLHIVVADSNNQYSSSKVITSEVPESIELIQKALENGTLYAGRFNSSGRILLPHLLRQWGINSSYKLSELEELGLKDMITTLKRDDPRLGYPRIAIMFVGSGDYLIQELLNDESLSLRGLSPADVIELNKSEKVDLEITNFGGIYDKYSSITTAGVMAKLIASNDLSTSELHNFILILKNLYSTDKFINITGNPPVLINDIEEFLERDIQDKWFEFIRSFMIFILSVVGTAYIIASMLLSISSNIKQGKFYKNIFKVYNLVVEKNNNTGESISGIEHDSQYQKAIRLIEGMIALEKIGLSVREDYSTGGLTIKHHQYLLDNLNHVFTWFETKLVNRLSFVIEKTPKEPKRIKELKEKLLKWHSNGNLKMDSYNILMAKF